MRTIPDDARAVLKRGVVNFAGLSYTLPDGQLERPLYESVNSVLADYGGKWSRSKKAHLFPDRSSLNRLNDAITTGKSQNLQSARQSFFTPEPLVERMVKLANVKPGMKVLEPSHGDGRIAMALYRAGCEVWAIEKDEDLHDNFSAKCCGDNLSVERMYLHHMDFLNFDRYCEEKFQAIVMNPPFTKGQDAKHILHAYSLLGQGGTLVAIASAGVRFRRDKPYRDVAALVKDNGGDIEELPKDTFKESGTSVNTVLLVIPKL